MIQRELTIINRLGLHARENFAFPCLVQHRQVMLALVDRNFLRKAHPLQKQLEQLAVHFVNLFANLFNFQVISSLFRSTSAEGV